MTALTALSSEVLFASSIQEQFGATRFEFIGQAYRGGYTEIKLGKVNLKLKDVKRKLRLAMRLAGVKSQGKGFFGTRSLSEDSTPEFYLQSKDWMAVVSLAGTEENASLEISFGG